MDLDLKELILYINSVNKIDKGITKCGLLVIKLHIEPTGM